MGGQPNCVSCAGWNATQFSSDLPLLREDFFLGRKRGGGEGLLLYIVLLLTKMGDWKVDWFIWFRGCCIFFQKYVAIAGLFDVSLKFFDL